MRESQSQITKVAESFIPPTTPQAFIAAQGRLPLEGHGISLGSFPRALPFSGLAALVHVGPVEGPLQVAYFADARRDPSLLGALGLGEPILCLQMLLQDQNGVHEALTDAHKGRTFFIRAALIDSVDPVRRIVAGIVPRARVLEGGAGCALGLRDASIERLSRSSLVRACMDMGDREGEDGGAAASSWTADAVAAALTEAWSDQGAHRAGSQRARFALLEARLRANRLLQAFEAAA